jgi:hypothetical protein
MPWLKLRDAAARIGSGLHDWRLHDQPPTRNEVKQAARALDVLEPPHDHIHERDLPRVAQQILVHRFGVFQAPGGSPRPPAHPARRRRVTGAFARALRNVPRYGFTAPAPGEGRGDASHP